MIDNYIIEKRKKLKISKERDNYIFGFCFGLFIFLISMYSFLSTPDIKILNVLNITFIILGLTFILLAIIYPNSLDFIHNKILKKAINFIGKILFIIILTIIYFVFVVPFGLIIRKKECKQIKKNNTNFYNYTNADNFKSSKKGIYNILQIFRIFANERYALMIPLIVILIVIGLLFIFVQSSVVTPFIYTLF